MVVFKFVSIIFCIFILMFFIMYVLYIIYIICMKVKVICILKLSIYFFYLFKVKRVEVKLFYKFGEFIFEIMFKDVFREIEKILKYFIK